MKYLTSLTILFLFSLTSMTVPAADIQVRVFERGGKEPLAGVAVCLGTPARIGQFGASLTDGSGNAMFNNVPRTTILVTASRDGYKAEQETMVSSAGNRMLVISLPTGGGGTQCPLPLGETATRASGGLGISRFAMSSGTAVTTTRNVTLDNLVSGQPTQYRASEMANFRGAGWQDYSQAPAFQLSAGPGKKTIYFQVRRHASLNGANLETLSPVRKDSIVLQ
ncbi:MAG: carboxypeptidase regulatory-like domain-containing protein [Gammaproteobacteria bacterium]|nr:carboxypeptidase regulatory-like domain-containing protein [Gammaproteobacteria bacterium]